MKIYNHMKKIAAFLVPISILLGCKTETPTPIDITFLVHDWRVLNITSSGETQPQLPARPYIFKFTSKKEFSFALEVNTSGGLYEIPSPGKMKINWHGNGKLCCDSKYSGQMEDVVITVTNYTLNSDTLTLIGTGEVKLKRI